MSKNETKSAEAIRLQEDATRAKNWKRWGPYLSERQWATVREDYSPGGTCWEYFPHEQARSRAYRSASPTASAGFVSRSRSGMGATRF